MKIPALLMVIFSVFSIGCARHAAYYGGGYYPASATGAVTGVYVNDPVYPAYSTTRVVPSTVIYRDSYKVYPNRDRYGRGIHRDHRYNNHDHRNHYGNKRPRPVNQRYSEHGHGGFAANDHRRPISQREHGRGDHRQSGSFTSRPEAGRQQNTKRPRNKFRVLPQRFQRRNEHRQQQVADNSNRGFNNFRGDKKRLVNRSSNHNRTNRNNRAGSRSFRQSKIR